MKAKIMFIAIVSVSLLLVPCALAKNAGQNPSDLVKFQKLLDLDGFDVTEGAVVPWNLAEQWCSYTPGVDNAWYSNNEPYLQYQVPTESGNSAIFKMDESEAVVVIGKTPPPVKYFSWTPFLATRLFPATGDIPERRNPILASVGDAVNNGTVRTIGDTPFDAPVVLIFTPDQGTDARVREALVHADYPEGIINTLVFPASMLNLGHGDAADELRILSRAAIWDDKAEEKAYMERPPLRIFRVTPRIKPEPNPFPVPKLRIHGTGQTEMDLMNKLWQLRNNIIAHNSEMVATDIEVTAPANEGYYYIQRGVDPWGDSRDAFVVFGGYMQQDTGNDNDDDEYPNDPITLADGEFLMIYGPNHVATGKATYMNINVYASKDAKLSIGALDDSAFPGTAASYLQRDPDADLMFAIKVSRNCGDEPNCLSLSADNCPRLTIDENTILGFVIRTYLEPETLVGPTISEMLYDRVIKFSPQPPQP